MERCARGLSPQRRNLTSAARAHARRTRSGWLPSRPARRTGRSRSRSCASVNSRLNAARRSSSNALPLHISSTWVASARHSTRAGRYRWPIRPISPAATRGRPPHTPAPAPASAPARLPRSRAVESSRRRRAGTGTRVPDASCIRAKPARKAVPSELGGATSPILLSVSSWPKSGPRPNRAPEVPVPPPSPPLHSNTSPARATEQ